MRKIIPPEGSERIVTKFLVRPKTFKIAGTVIREKRWLTFSKVVEKYDEYGEKWKIVAWNR